MAIVPSQSLQNLSVDNSYGSLLLVVPNPPTSPGNEGVITTYKKLASGDGNNTLIGISETGLKIFSGGELTADSGVILSGFIISGMDNSLRIKTSLIPPVALQPGELVLVDKVLYFLDGMDTIQSFDLGVAPNGTTITYDLVNHIASANLSTKVFNFQEKIILSATQPNTADYPEGMLWLNNSVSPYVLYYLDKSNTTPVWLPVTGQDVAAHAAIYGLGGHIPTTGITDAEVNGITKAKITDLDLTTFMNAPVVDNIAGPTTLEAKSPWVKDNLFWWFINSQYRTGVELDQSVVINNPGNSHIVGGFPPGYSYLMTRISILWDIEPPDGNNTLLDSSHKYQVTITRGSTTYGMINIDRSTDRAEVLIPSAIIENPANDFDYKIVANITTVGSPPTLNNIVVILSYQKILN